MTTQYHVTIQIDKGVSKNVETENPENIVSIRRGTTEILSEVGVTSRLYSGVQAWMLSHRSESFNSRMSFNFRISLESNENLGAQMRSENSVEQVSNQMSLKWKAWMCFMYVYKCFS